MKKLNKLNNLVKNNFSEFQEGNDENKDKVDNLVNRIAVVKNETKIYIEEEKSKQNSAVKE